MLEQNLGRIKKFSLETRRRSLQCLHWEAVLWLWSSTVLCLLLLFQNGTRIVYYVCTFPYLFKCPLEGKQRQVTGLVCGSSNHEELQRSWILSYMQLLDKSLVLISLETRWLIFPCGKLGIYFSNCEKWLMTDNARCHKICIFLFNFNTQLDRCLSLTCS